jgi:hypothetical protein
MMAVSPRKVWLLAGTAAVALVAAQATTALLVWQHTRPRLPPLAPVAATLDQAIAAVVTAAADHAAIAVSGVVAYTACQNTILAKGSRFNRSADLYTDPGTEDTLLATIAGRLPAADHPQRATPIGGGAAPLIANLGGQIQLRVAQLGQGWLEAVAETDCRSGTPAPAVPAPSTQPRPSKASVDQLLYALGTGVDSWHTDTVHTDTVTCPAGQIITLSAISRATTTDRLPTRLAPLLPAGAHTFASPANRLAWRDGADSVIVAASDDGTHLTVQHTTGC